MSRPVELSARLHHGRDIQTNLVADRSIGSKVLCCKASHAKSRRSWRAMFANVWKTWALECTSGPSSPTMLIPNGEDQFRQCYITSALGRSLLVPRRKWPTPENGRRAPWEIARSRRGPIRNLQPCPTRSRRPRAEFLSTEMGSRRCQQCASPGDERHGRPSHQSELYH